MARIIDVHTHLWPKAVYEKLVARRNEYLGINFKRWKDGKATVSYTDGMNWHNLDQQLAHMDRLGHEVEIVGWIAQPAAYFTDLPPAEGRDMAYAWNEEIAAAQRSHPGRFWGTAALPFTDTNMSIEVMERAVKDGLVGINIPSCVGKNGRIDAAHLEPLYDRVEELGLTMFVHPTDVHRHIEMLDGYDGALFASLGRIADSSATALRLVLSGIMERHPKLKVFMSHTGGALPYQAGRMDKNTKAAGLPQPASTYIKRMYTDTVSPHAAGMKFAIDYYGVDQVMYGTDFPCWDPAEALRLLAELGLSPADQTKILSGNAQRLLGLPGRVSEAVPAAV